MNDILRKKLYLLLIYLHNNNSYYNTLIPNHFNIDETYDVFQSLPISTKEDLRKFSTFEFMNEKEIVINFTSGTDGKPLRCIKTIGESNVLAKNLFVARKKTDPKYDTQKLVDIFGLKNHRNLIGDFSNFQLNNMELCYSELLNLQPRWIVGSQSILNRYALMIQERSMPKIDSLKYIELVGERIDIAVRKNIEDIFCAKTVNHYGCKETWCIALECSQGNLHVLPSVFIESTKDDHLLLTSFVNRLMPTIRYKVGDIGKVDIIDCACGCRSQIIKSLQGREVITIEGYNNLIGDIFFKRIIYKQYKKNPLAIKQFKVIQKNIDLFEILIISESDFGIISQQIIEDIKAELDDKVRVEVRHVDCINNNKEQIFVKNLEIQ